MSFPENITTVPITGRLLAGTADGPRPTTQRQAVRARFLVEFTPEVPKIPAPEAAGGPMTFYRGGGLPFAPVMGVVDSRGYLCTPDPDNREIPMFEGVRLIATDDESLAVKDWTWRVTIKTIEGALVESYSIAVPAAAAVNGLDLTNLAPVPSTPGYGIPQAEAAAAMAAQNSTIAVQSVERAEATVEAIAARALTAAAVVGDDLILSKENGSTINAGNVRGPEGPAGPNTIPTATAVATEIGTAGTPANDALLGLFPLKSLWPVNIRDWGAVGDGVTADHAAINAAAAGGKKDIYFPAGRYLIQDTLRLHRQTRITLHPEAVILNDNLFTEFVFLNGELGNAEYATGYAGDGNIHITGGTIDNGPQASKGRYSCAIGIAHAENILIENVHFRNNYRSHFIELNSTRNGVVRNCTFTDLNPDGSTNREAINIDYAQATGFPAFGGYDNTPCDNILIDNCTFTRVQDGVGSHMGAPHRNIRVRDCVFIDLSGRPVRTSGWVSGSMTDCTVRGAYSLAAQLDSTNDFTVQRNRFYEVGLQADGYHAAVIINGGSNCYAGENVIENTGGIRYAMPYRVSSGTGHRINTGGAKPGSTGRLVDNSGTMTVVDGTTACIIADDTAAVIPVPGADQQGLVFITMRSALSTSPRGMYWCRASGTPVVQSVAALPAADVVLTTGALTGTTGTDGKVTVSAHSNGNLYIENRYGSSRIVDVRFVAA